MQENTLTAKRLMKLRDAQRVRAMSRQSYIQSKRAISLKGLVQLAIMLKP